jgi:hypothetical protein
MSEPKITFEYAQRGKDDPTPYRAHIDVVGSDHHGMGASPAEALYRAAGHWLSYESQKGRAALSETEGG